MLLHPLIYLTIHLIDWITANSYNPEQVHLSLGDNGFDIVVTWSTLTATNNSIVKYGFSEDNLEFSTYGASNIFIDDGIAKRSQEIHRVQLTNLQPSTRYYYSCGSYSAYSKVFHFKTFPNHTNWSPRFAIYGDLGLWYGFSIDALIDEVQNGFLDVILHNGDLAYNFCDDNGTFGDNFMNKIEPIAAYIPYMTSPGNHESAYNFTHYINRFTMPGNNQNLYYSINIGPVHVIMFSSEFYYFLEHYHRSDEYPYYTMANVEAQYNWLLNDLKIAATNRDKQPWIMALAHRPMYCTSTPQFGDDCTNKETKLRVGIGEEKMFGLEKMFYDYGMDVEFWAHEHTYERFYPLYNFVVYNGSSDYPYVNPNAPVHILVGSAGCQEKDDQFTQPQPSHSAYRSEDYGYTRLTVFNNTHAYFDFNTVKPMSMFDVISEESKIKTQVSDQFWLIKDQHGPYTNSFLFKK